MRLLRRDADGVLMETLRGDDHVTLTCRYRVQGRDVVPVSQTSLGPIDLILATLLGLALAAAFMVGRHALVFRAGKSTARRSPQAIDSLRVQDDCPGRSP